MPTGEAAHRKHAGRWTRRWTAMPTSARAAISALRKALQSMTPEAVTEEVKDSNLRGRGGAGFPTGLKWTFVPWKDAPHPRYLVANADEMEPGTFKDRLLLEGDPHQLIEGMTLAGYATGTDIAYIFLRGEYKLAASETCESHRGSLCRPDIWERTFSAPATASSCTCTSAPAATCAAKRPRLLNALEGKRANPRAKPPFPPVSGLFGKPTTVNNVETLCNVPHIINNGAAWFRSLSRSKDGGTKLYGASGKVKRPGIWELPMGVTIREILEEHAGGMRDGVRVSRAAPRRGFHGFSRGTAPGRRHGLHRSAEGGQPHGYRHHDRARRPDLSGRHGLEPGTLFRAGILRLVHAVLERPGMGGAHPEGDGRRARPTRRPGQVGVSNTVLGARPHFLRTGARRRRTAAERIEIFPRRFRAAHQRETLPVEMTMATVYVDNQAVPDEPEAEPAARLSVTGLQSAVLLLAPRAGLGGRLPPVRRQAVQG